jgi:hypothetical protein
VASAGMVSAHRGNGGAVDSPGVAVKRGWWCGRFDVVIRRCRVGRTAAPTWSYERRFGL